MLKEIPEGQQAKGTTFESVATALAGLNIEDVKSASAVKADWTTTYTCRIKNGITYSLSIGKDGETHYLRAEAQPVSAAAVEAAKRVGKEEAKEALDEKSKVLEAASNQVHKVFNGQHQGWVYKVPSWKAGNLTKPFAELIEKKPDPADPKEIAASHILFSYKGADRSESKRSKKAAKAEAAKILKTAKAPGADFAALAKKYSNGPSAAKGGDLGTFPKGQMHKNFEAAAWKLKVGELSDLVETPFGFHIIKRTK
jgi:parvulin-like peptidyl-prolyl isomerase